jgi:hypothetical protein
VICDRKEEKREKREEKNVLVKSFSIDFFSVPDDDENKEESFLSSIFQS